MELQGVRSEADCNLLSCYPKYMLQKQLSFPGKVRYDYCKTVLNSLSFDFLIFRLIHQN